MEFNITVNGDKLKIEKPVKIGHTGNVNSYRCIFAFSDEWNGLTPFFVVCVGGIYFTAPIIENTCLLPMEACIKPGYISVGVFGTNGNEAEFKRISTCFKNIYIEQGAYHNGEVAPDVPTPDIWEVLINKNIPYIGKNGNWYVYDINKKCHVDTGCISFGKDGYTPVKGIDYWSEADKNDVVNETLDILEPKLDSTFDEITQSLDAIISIQNGLMGVSE